ncbi:anthranilate phosphoribosyltransferase [Aquabacterium commune]|uniref:Anthranilate phosphoribosyltransferase n=1 Tax=Aquabacterium commune TaxID=70586 RepID=A0A4R6R8K3_9BURK|nr:DNA-binding protein YbiB [Aquabacterium commune]TDP82214.1 anthranilate phosphoribosyltransferase [Aquabacterium commune]
MAIAAYIKEIGRGKDGARALSTEQAHDLMSQVLDGQVSDLELGAFCLAMRIKGETAEELAGFVQATHERCLDLRPALAQAQAAATAPLLGPVLLPSYNGSRKLPNLTPLLAWALAQRGVAVLVHGPRQDPTRITSAQVFAAGGWPVAEGAADVASAWAARQPVFMPTEVLCPALARLLAVRWVIGLRNPGHTVAKLLNPLGLGMQVVNHTHPEYAASLSNYLALVQANALLMRGTEGEPVADARRQPRFDVFLQGQREEALCRAPVEGVLVSLPELPEGREADVTAAWIQSVVEGQAPLPAAIAAQADCLGSALAALNTPSALGAHAPQAEPDASRP